MDIEFIRRAERLTSFNLSSTDFGTLTYKREIQYLIGKHFFPTFNLSQTIEGLDVERLNGLINQLRQCDEEMLHKLLLYPLKGVGPGEILLFFLIDNAIVGGPSSAGVDLLVGDDGRYEIKAATVSKAGFATNFKLGGAVPLASLMTDIVWMNQNIQSNLSDQKWSGTSTEISGREVQRMRQACPLQFEALESRYAELAYEHYFKHHPVIFINNSVQQRLGLIEKVMYVQPQHISIERLTNGTLKPRIYIHDHPQADDQQAHDSPGR